MILTPIPTLPFNVVAANSLASAVALGVDSIELVIVHASGLEILKLSEVFSLFAFERCGSQTSGTFPDIHVRLIFVTFQHCSA